MLLEVQNLKVKYGSIEALHGISFNVKEGEIVTLIGANGAGKTTTLHTITRVPPPEGPKVCEGDILFKGKSILNLEPHEVVHKLHIGLAPEGRHIFGNLTVEENLKLATYARNDDSKIKEDYKLVYRLFPRLYERRKQRSESLSGGEQQMLAVGRALMTGANFLLLDEPSMGLAPLLMYEMFRALKELNQKEGITILLIEQNALLALQFAHRGYVLDTGEIVLSGTSEELLNNPEVKKAYLGG
ncbi:amino acid/amide ABC transporter ATP-binding protein 2, HAAT family [Desulfonauticus submarinus]|uniref:Amino acid/amide ABC transporter ATP-binding protein 2, HAAT family n=1 Tax=Desulfonauticus submarinus TaxID=206665 RepID=A0A1H0D2M8_9BACT|nr:ABC transporter ATP-binding protein [Desulfonauticus submarinus]SDN64407.1 amino acid/amide ABC transporter ATP-binding protein 2, HAAT family [Desulfonauticus submarinus]